MKPIPITERAIAAHQLAAGTHPAFMGRQLAALVNAIGGTRFTVADVIEVRGRKVLEVAGEVRFTLRILQRPFPAELELMDYYCSDCETWIPTLTVVETLAAVGARIDQHRRIHGEPRLREVAL